MLALHLFPCLLFRRGAAPFPGPPKSLPQRSSSCAPAPCLPEHKITCSPYTYSPAYCSGEELRHFLALLRAYPSAAAAVPQLPSPLCVHQPPYCQAQASWGCQRLGAAAVGCVGGCKSLRSLLLYCLLVYMQACSAFLLTASASCVLGCDS